MQIPLLSKNFLMANSIKLNYQTYQTFIGLPQKKYLYIIVIHVFKNQESCFCFKSLKNQLFLLKHEVQGPVDSLEKPLQIQRTQKRVQRIILST